MAATTEAFAALGSSRTSPALTVAAAKGAHEPAVYAEGTRVRYRSSISRRPEIVTRASSAEASSVPAAISWASVESTESRTAVARTRTEEKAAQESAVTSSSARDAVRSSSPVRRARSSTATAAVNSAEAWLM
ncbi:hypothetical protein Q0F99_05530 [Rathayibacter oskolensis]|uniref:hypothetical protein n=1 Tax=Rathayibacter oskolensis TaxID=1891671 RepID=UPI00265EFEF3|nr:hypothetical protein [Rathayibacter oskolensis]WKK72421.1 hypothetical protein Q0F99_05530 [Rathayibacter oskolensis]